ncbi:MAG: glutathione S-transferase family protein [Pseudomonadota bacterium]
MQLTLVSHALCPYVQRAVIALRERGVQFERIDIDLADKPAWFLAVSPLGKTPVLLADGKAVFESAVICEYLEDILPAPLHPGDALLRAQHRGWIEFASATLNGIGAFYRAGDEAAYHASANVLGARFGRLEQVLGDGPYFAGASFSLVDAAFGPAFRYFDVYDGISGIDLFAAVPKVRAWRSALAVRPSVHSAAAPDYAARLAAFTVKQGGVLGARLAAHSGLA